MKIYKQILELLALNATTDDLVVRENTDSMDNEMYVIIGTGGWIIGSGNNKKELEQSALTMFEEKNWKIELSPEAKQIYNYWYYYFKETLEPLVTQNQEALNLLELAVERLEINNIEKSEQKFINQIEEFLNQFEQ